MYHKAVGEWEQVVADPMRRCWLHFKKSLWSEALLNRELEIIMRNTQWTKLLNREGKVTRSTAWFVADNCACNYAYGDVSIQATSMPAWLRAINARVLGEGCGLPEEEWPNSVNLNMYEDGDQNVGWHSDDEDLFAGTKQDCC